ncbi:3'(2'),5'-bisphosphate nucleotidase CysQ [Labrenzia sp. R4_1]|uniref:3'(2'),5'-bisphosphate nucleotidase CysQ n=1 Tax=Labrenzia sp. R4_1 TaxID=2821106 RepID=UPI001ADC54D5|nr:3'(2'),5'-bisphosphate nucleotidase CysQ [Labrenzia sp. R4_1]MBO9427797.1 3'(2'),5'-bisphosphate nucleotidase CysQ [Labrenzia sp. R4_1]
MLAEFFCSSDREKNEHPEILLDVALEAGAAILDIYATPFEVNEKTDGSPVTAADAAAEAIIMDRLTTLFPDIPVVAEEAASAGNLPNVGDTYFLVDPLDGTKEFLNKNGEFTVNIALIASGVPVFGIVYAPALGDIYWSGRQEKAHPLPTDLAGAFYARVEEGKLGVPEKISTRTPNTDYLTVLASRSHLSDETARLIDRLNVAETVSVGSSLKLCWIAAGKADLYPRLAPTMQWDIAAGHAIVSAAGGAVVSTVTAEDLSYAIPENAVTSDLLNDQFLAIGDPSKRPNILQALKM